jgi:hypothetical protein
MAGQSQHRITAVLKNSAGAIVRDLGTWNTLAGGETTAEIPTDKPGGGGKKSYGAKPDHSDITITRVRERERDHELDRWLRGQVGRLILEVADQPLDDDDVAWGTPIITRGRLSGVLSTDIDSNGTDLRRIEVTATVEAMV